jgi:hypothetical protein
MPLKKKNSKDDTNPFVKHPFLTPVVKQLMGKVKLRKGFNFKKEYAGYLSEKYS